MKINENIAYSKSILNKLQISETSKEYEDYLKIKEICGKNHGASIQENNSVENICWYFNKNKIC